MLLVKRFRYYHKKNFFISSIHKNRPSFESLSIMMMKIWWYSGIFAGLVLLWIMYMRMRTRKAKGSSPVCSSEMGCPHLTASLRQQFDSLYGLDPVDIVPGSEVETQVDQFCSLGYAYQQTCPNPDETLSKIYSSLCVPLTTQSSKTFSSPKKTSVEKPKSTKCTLKVAWDTCSCDQGKEKGKSIRKVQYTSKDGKECPITPDIQKKITEKSACGEPSRTCRCLPPPPPIPELKDGVVAVQEEQPSTPQPLVTQLGKLSIPQITNYRLALQQEALLPEDTLVRFV